MSEQQSKEMLQATSLFCERDDRILFSALDFSLLEGEVLQVKGSNGSGKTTLLRILCGLNDNYSGTLNWYGEEAIDRYEDYLSSLLYIGHRIGVNKVLTPLENLKWSCALESKIEESQLMAALKEVGLRGFEYSQCFGLSAGQQQRVALARLLISPARLWILDEPFTTLDVKGVAHLESMLEQHANEGGAAIVTTHHGLKVKGLRELNLG